MMLTGSRLRQLQVMEALRQAIRMSQPYVIQGIKVSLAVRVESNDSAIAAAVRLVRTWLPQRTAHSTTALVTEPEPVAVRILPGFGNWRAMISICCASAFPSVLRQCLSPGRRPSLVYAPYSPETCSLQNMLRGLR
jgi:hypothetical protein